MTKEELYEIIASDEGYRIELTTSTTDMAKFQDIRELDGVGRVQVQRHDTRHHRAGALAGAH